MTNEVHRRPRSLFPSIFPSFILLTSISICDQSCSMILLWWFWLPLCVNLFHWVCFYWYGVPIHSQHPSPALNFIAFEDFFLLLYLVSRFHSRKAPQSIRILKNKIYAAKRNLECPRARRNKSSSNSVSRSSQLPFDLISE